VSVVCAVVFGSFQGLSARADYQHDYPTVVVIFDMLTAQPIASVDEWIKCEEYSEWIGYFRTNC